MRISYWSSDVCSSDLVARAGLRHHRLHRPQDRLPRGGDPHRPDPRPLGRAVVSAGAEARRWRSDGHVLVDDRQHPVGTADHFDRGAVLQRLAQEPAHARSEEHTSELQSLMRISYAVFCLTKKKKIKHKLN